MFTDYDKGTRGQHKCGTLAKKICEAIVVDGQLSLPFPGEILVAEKK